MQVKLHPFFQADPETGDEGINWKELVTQKAAFIPSSESRLAPSMYFEEKPVSFADNIHLILKLTSWAFLQGGQCKD